MPKVLIIEDESSEGVDLIRELRTKLPEDLPSVEVVLWCVAEDDGVTPARVGEDNSEDGIPFVRKLFKDVVDEIARASADIVVLDLCLQPVPRDKNTEQLAIVTARGDEQFRAATAEVAPRFVGTKTGLLLAWQLARRRGSQPRIIITSGMPPNPGVLAVVCPDHISSRYDVNEKVEHVLSLVAKVAWHKRLSTLEEELRDLSRISSQFESNTSDPHDWLDGGASPEACCWWTSHTDASEVIFAAARADITLSVNQLGFERVKGYVQGALRPAGLIASLVEGLSVERFAEQLGCGAALGERAMLRLSRNGKEWIGENATLEWLRGTGEGALSVFLGDDAGRNLQSLGNEEALPSILEHDLVHTMLALAGGMAPYFGIEVAANALVIKGKGPLRDGKCVPFERGLNPRKTGEGRTMGNLFSAMSKLDYRGVIIWRIKDDGAVPMLRADSSEGFVKEYCSWYEPVGNIASFELRLTLD